MKEWLFGYEKGVWAAASLLAKLCIVILVLHYAVTVAAYGPVPPDDNGFAFMQKYLYGFWKSTMMFYAIPIFVNWIASFRRFPSWHKLCSIGSIITIVFSPVTGFGMLFLVPAGLTGVMIFILLSPLMPRQSDTRA